MYPVAFDEFNSVLSVTLRLTEPIKISFPRPTDN